MSTVAVVITRRVEFPGMLSIDAGIATPGGVEVLSADQLLIAHTCIELFTRSAPAVPDWDPPVTQLVRLPGRTGKSAIGEAETLWPDAGVDDSYDDILTGSAHATQLIP